MSWASVPALPAAAALLAGTRLGLEADFAPSGLLVALALLGLALGRWTGWILVALALGLLNGSLRGAPPILPDPDRPVTALLETTGHWRRLGDVRSAAVTTIGIEQGGRVWPRPLEAYLNLPDGDEPPPFGARLRVRGYLSRPAVLGNPPLRSPGPWRLRVKSSRLMAVEAGPGVVERLAGSLRRRVERGYEAVLEGSLADRASGDDAAGSGADRTLPGRGLGLPFARALLLGDSSEVPPRVVRGLRRLGLAHLLAVSGLHVGLAAALALLLARSLPRVPRLLVGLLAVALYLLLVGPRPSLLRASVMVTLAVAALLLERPPSALNALGVAAAGIVLHRPEAVVDLGFQLSAGATAGLLLLAPRLTRSWSWTSDREPSGRRSGRAWARLPGLLREPLAVSAGAQLGTLPWALPAFCLVVPVAPLVNLVAVPWAGLLLAAAGLWTGLAAVAPGAAAPLLGGLDLLAAPFAWPAGLPAAPWLSLPLAPGHLEATLLAAAAFAALLRPRLGLPVLAMGLLWAAVPVSMAELRQGGPVEAVFVDVGQGDAILLRDGTASLLVDGGGWPAGDLGGRVLLPALARRGVRSLDRVLLTHPDQDHCGGLVEVASYLAVGEVLTGPGPPAGSADPGSRSALPLAAPGGCDAELRTVPGVRHRPVAAGDRLEVGRWRLRVLHPPPTGAAGASAGDNDASVVVLAEVFGRRLLLTGDIEAAAERRLLAAGAAAGGDTGPPDLACDFLKVAHHGSRSSSTDRFLAAASPRLALISAGARNPYGHPAAEILARLRRHGSRVLRTDRDGMIVLSFHPDGRWAIDLPGAPKR
ncbi:MAG TPA: ComEC/Rec2 family competence protein [Thermoanaerobaculia bacterium]|nr:ComEC/Rec2 family competence protein [Thermoanaerobaculia bacterium]